jgi:hypothetical protein
MATRPMQRVLNPRNRSTSLDIEKENFEKSQVFCLQFYRIFFLIILTKYKFKNISINSL